MSYTKHPHSNERFKTFHHLGGLDGQTLQWHLQRLTLYVRLCIGYRDFDHLVYLAQMANMHENHIFFSLFDLLMHVLEDNYCFGCIKA